MLMGKERGSKKQRRDWRACRGGVEWPYHGTVVSVVIVQPVEERCVYNIIKGTRCIMTPQSPFN